MSAPERADARSLIVALEPLPISTAEARLAFGHRLSRRHPVDLTETVAGRIRHWAERSPRRVAVVSRAGEITYEQLAHRVAAVAAHLAGQGCAAGEVVAVTGPRGADSIVVFLALEHLGAVYLPVDATWPPARLASVLRRGGAARMIDYHPDPVASPVDLPVITLPEPAGPAGVALEPLRTHCPDAAEPRYVYFTSGSTGEPKGALNEHRGLINHLWAKIVDLRLTETDVLACTAPLTFDISAWQMLAMLLIGGRVAVLDEQETAFPRTLHNRLREREVTTLELVPTMLAWLVDDAAPVSLPRLRCLMSTGEELTPRLAASLLGRFAGVRLVNAYGFTETSDDVTHHVVTEADLADPRLPVGTVVINADLYVLIENSSGGLRAAAPGEVGELFVGGLPPGCGYLGAGQVTRRAFFADVFDPASPTGRLYRSGDSVVVEHGVLRYVGRLDRQIKVAGVRMEPGEIEAALRGHADVAACAVVPQVVDGQRRLVACYVPRTDRVGPDELRVYLADRVPAAMVPYGWRSLPSLPVSANGKTDYRALATLLASSA